MTVSDRKPGIAAVPAIALIVSIIILAKGSPDEVITVETMKAVYDVDVRLINIDNQGSRKACIPVLNGETN